MADKKLNTGPAENTSPEAAEPITTPEQAAASEPRQDQTGPATPEPGDVIVSFDKINELMAEKRQNARAEVEKAETPETPQPANTEEPKKLRRGRPPKADKTASDKPKPSKRDKPYTRVHSRSGTSSNYDGRARSPTMAAAIPEMCFLCLRCPAASIQRRNPWSSASI